MMMLSKFPSMKSFTRTSLLTANARKPSSTSGKGGLGQTGAKVAPKSEDAEKQPGQGSLYDKPELYSLAFG